MTAAGGALTRSQRSPRRARLPARADSRPYPVGLPPEAPRQVADSVLPDNPFVYPVFDLTNPFPTDWMGVRITHGPGSRILDAARRLDADGDYTVLFQTFNVFRLASMGSVPAASPRSLPYSRTGVEVRLAEILAGERSACGSFLVIHSPPRAR